MPQREQQQAGLVAAERSGAGPLNFFSEPGCLTIEAAVVAGPMVAATVSFANAGHEMATMSARTGIGVSSLSQLAYAARKCGLDNETLESGIRKMQKTLYAAANGSGEARDALAAIGLTIEDINGLPVEEKFKAIADRIAAIQSPTKRAGVAMAIFGRGGTSMLPMLAEGADGINALCAEADRLGLTMSAQSAASAVQMHDSMITLWAVLKKVQSAIATALAPTLTAAARWLTDVTGRAIGWVKANQDLVLMVFKVAAAVIAVGFVFVGLGTAIGWVGRAFSVFASIVPIVSSVLGAVGAVLVWLVSPIGLLIGAIAALGIYYAYSTGQIGKATSWLGECWNTMKDDALTAFGGISDALAAGDIGLAAQVLWALLKLEWARGTGWLSNLWTRSMNFLITVFTEAWAGLKVIAYAVWHGLEVAWIETTAFLADAWYWFVGIFKRSWEEMKAVAKKAWNWIKNLFGETTDEEYRAANAQVDAEKQAAVAKIKDETTRKRAERELQRQQEREQSGREFDQTVHQVVRDQETREQGLNAETKAKEQANRADVDAAKKRLSDLAGKAKGERKAKDAGKPEGMKSPEEVLGKLKNALAGMGDELDIANKEKRKMEAHGTFNAAALLGLQAGGPQERIANATEKTARNTDKLLNRAQVGALVFQ